MEKNAINIPICNIKEFDFHEGCDKFENCKHTILFSAMINRKIVPTLRSIIIYEKRMIIVAFIVLILIVKNTDFFIRPIFCVLLFCHSIDFEVS